MPPTDKPRQPPLPPQTSADPLYFHQVVLPSQHTPRLGHHACYVSGQCHQEEAGVGEHIIFAAFRQTCCCSGA